jgi:phasin family protein
MTETITKAQEATQQAARKATEQTTQVAQQATEQFRGAINEANERGKVAMEKSARIVEELADLTRGNVEALVASSKTAAKYVETLTQGAADYSRRSFEEASTALRSFAEVKSPTDFFRLQSDYARSAFDSMVAESARVSETVVKMSGEVAEPITSRYSVAAERLTAVAA